MPLSRHFYAVDEVHAALSYRTTGCDRAETLFWCQELLLSGYASETISTLFESWLWYKGPFCLAWLATAERLASNEVTEDDIRLSAYHLSWKECCDHSLWNILVLEYYFHSILFLLSGQDMNQTACHAQYSIHS